jgi:hypothetical protein
VDENALNVSINVRISFEDRQILKVIEDKVLNMIIIFQSLLDTIRTLLQHWEILGKQKLPELKPDMVVSGLDDARQEVELYLKNTKSLHKRVQGTATLVSYPESLKSRN